MAKIEKKEWVRVLKFTLISISAGLIEAGTFAIFELIGLDYWISHVASLLLAVLWNFTINRKYTFKSANNVTIAMLLTLGFYVVFTPLSTIGGNALVGAGWDEFLVKAITLILNFVLEFLYTRFIVYRNSCDTAVKTENKENE